MLDSNSTVKTKVFSDDYVYFESIKKVGTIIHSMNESNLYPGVVGRCWCDEYSKRTFCSSRREFLSMPCKSRSDFWCSHGPRSVLTEGNSLKRLRSFRVQIWSRFNKSLLLVPVEIEPGYRRYYFQLCKTRDVCNRLN